MKGPFIFILICLIYLTATASIRPELAVNLIPDSLLRGAHSVVRSSEVTFDVTSPSQAEYKKHTITTVMDESAAGELSIYLGYDQFHKIRSMSATVYDHDGKQMNKHTLKDMNDYAAFAGYTLFSDARAKYLQVAGGQYPVTVDIEYTIDHNGLLSYPTWYVQGNGQSVESSTMTVTAPSEIDVYYKAYRTSMRPVATTTTGTKQYVWETKSLKAHRLSDESYGAHYYLPSVFLSPAQFEIAGHKGSTSTWQSFAAAIGDMWKDKRKLPESVESEIKSMVKGARTDHEKVSILYSYLQKNFRYVSVQIGIGGWIPFDAATVHETKYGDCKALSNYMCAILQAAGVKSYPVLINGGYNEHSIDTTFPTNHFNHAILYAVADGEPMWLECTNSALPAGDLSTFTENRCGLMLDDNGGRILRTPMSAADMNVLTMHHDVQLTTEGNASVSGDIDMTGEWLASAKPGLLLATEKEQVKYVYSHLHLKQPSDAAVSLVRDSAYRIRAELSGTKDHMYDFKTGNKNFLPSTLMTQWYDHVAIDSNAKYDVLLGFPSDKREEIVYHPGYGVVSLPPDMGIDNDLLSYHRSSKKSDDNTVTVLTELKMKVYVVHPSDLALLKESLQKVNKSLQLNVIVEDITKN